MFKKLFIGALVVFALAFTVNCSAAVFAPSADDTHPYVYLNDDFIASLKNEDGSIKKEYENNYNYLKKLATGDLPAQPEGGYISSSISSKLMARALMYALGEFDYDHARATIEYTLKYLEKPLTSQTYSINMYKDLGTNGIQTGALVYDWCYDAFKEEEKELLASYIVELYEDTNGDGSPNYKQPASIKNPSSWGDLAGKAVGQPLIYNTIAVTALYDIRPDLYNNVMEKVQGDMAKIVKVYGSAGALSDGSISYTREHYSYYVYMLFKRLGAEDGWLTAHYGDQQPLGYKLMYSRLPYGTYFRYGDNHPNKIGIYTNGVETTDLGVLASMYKNSYFSHQYFKENHSSSTSILPFLVNDRTIQPELPDSLPLAYETKSPRSEVMARTSWQDGLNSKTVTVSMNMNERRSGDHDHGDIGSFQLYYKGPLTMPAGIYRGEEWGGTHWRNYYTRSVAANCVTVYMPGEVFKFGNRIAEANDGGQKMAGNKSGGYVIGDFDEHMADTNIWAVNEATFIGPNKNTPAFSYIKGDITKAYSSAKMSSYKRGMVFMDTFNDTYPGVMVVFDRVVSTNETYDKKWLLQAVTDPAVSGNKVTITNTTDGANGKLVNTTLLPESVSIEKVGGKAKYISDGKEWPAPETVDFDSMPEAYASGFRVEVSPSTENKEDIFLNAMYVTDADGNAPELPMIKESTNEFVGVTTLDRTVMFSKSGNLITNSFSVTVRNNNNGGKMLCLITDINPGKWTVSGNGVNMTLQSVTGDNCLTFSAVPGTYTISPASSSASLTTLNWPETQKEKLGDFVIKYGESYAYIPEPTYLKDGIPYISARTAEEFGVETSVSGNTLTIVNGQNKSVITVGADSYIHNGMSLSMNNPAISHNGTIYIPVDDVESAIAVNCTYVPESLVLKVTPSTRIEIDNYIPPKEITGIDNAVILSDGIVAESIYFSSKTYPYISTPITMYYGDTVKHITDIAVAGANGIADLKIYTSLDGKNYHLLSSEYYSLDSKTIAYKTDLYARYIKLEPISTIYINEVGVFGTDAEDVCGFVDSGIKEFNISDKLKTEAFIKPGFTSASLYIGETKISDISDDGDWAYNIDVSASELAMFNEGVYKLKLIVIYNGETYVSEKEIKLVERKEGVTFINEPIDGKSYSSVFGNRGSYNFSRNSQNSTESYTGDSYKLTFDKQVLSSVPYISLSGFKHGRGTYEINFETEISTKDIHLMLELRNGNNKPIDSGASYTILSGLEGTYEVTVVADTENSILQVYTRESGSNDEKSLCIEKKIKTDSFGQFRFNITNYGTSGYIAFDDINAVYKETGMSILSPEFSENISNKNVTLSAYAGEADEVSFCINGVEVKKFTSQTEDGIYEFETSFEDNGIKYFDVYVKNNDVISLKSSSFVYDVALEKGAKTFAGPFMPKVQSDGNMWINTTNTTTYFAGRVVFEGDLTLPSTTDRAYFELGGATDYDFTYGGTNYVTLSDAPGYGGTHYLFNEHGKIADTDITYKANTPMHIKYVCDTYTDTYEFYVDGVKILTQKGIPDVGHNKVGNLVNAKLVGCKVRLVYKDADASGDGTPTFSNVKTYQEYSAPEILSVTYDGNDAGSNAGFVVPEKTENITVYLSDGYTSLSTDNVSVLVDGIEITPEITFNADQNSLSLSNIELHSGNRVDVLISSDATVEVDHVDGGVSLETPGFALKTTIYVGDSRRIFAIPINASFNSGKVSAYAKYINAGNNPAGGSFIIAEYTDSALTLLKNTSYKPISFKASSSGLVTNYLIGVSSKENCKVMLWNEDLSPLTASAAIK